MGKAVGGHVRECCPVPGGGAEERGWLPEHLPTWAFPELEVRAGLQGPVGLEWKPAVCERNRLGSGGRAGHSSSHGVSWGKGQEDDHLRQAFLLAGAACRRWERCACFSYLWAQPGRGVPGDSLSWPRSPIKPFLHPTGLLPSPRGVWSVACGSPAFSREPALGQQFLDLCP